MRPQNINLAYAETMETCLATERDQECLHNPRRVEEDWSEDRVQALQRERHAFECDPEFYSREQRVAFSRRITHGQVYLHHSSYCAERLHVLQMIRGDVKGDLHEPTTTGARSGCARTAAARAARRRGIRAARSLSSEQGRLGPEALLDEPASSPTPLTDYSGSSTTATSPASSGQRSGHYDLQTTLDRVDTILVLLPATPQPVSSQNSLERLMLLGHLQESEERLRHLEHDAYVSNDEMAGLRHENAELREHNFQLKLEKVQQDQELVQTQNLLRSADEQFLNFLAAKNR